MDKLASHKLNNTPDVIYNEVYFAVTMTNDLKGRILNDKNYSIGS